MKLSLLLPVVLFLGSAAMAADTADTAPDRLPAARAAIEVEDYPAALELLTAANDATPGDADILNLLGFASRKSGALEAAAGYYAAALAVNPDHLGALEYQGELFLMLGDKAAAEANLARLSTLCGTCEEQADLAAALAGS